MPERKGPDSFWIAALKVGGVAAIALYVMYQIYIHYLALGNLVKLTQQQSFVVGLVLIGAVFIIAVIAIVMWYMDNEGARKAKLGLARIQLTDVRSGVEIEVPDGSTFQKTVTAIAEVKKSTVGFENFTESQLAVKLRSQKLAASDVATVLERIRDLGLGEIPEYTVKVEDGRYTLIAGEEAQK